MISLIKSDLYRYEDRNQNFLLSIVKTIYTNPSFLGIVWYRISHWLWLNRRNPILFILLIFNRFFYPFIRIYTLLELTPKTMIGEGLYIAHFGPTILHSGTVAGNNLTLLPGVVIGAAKSGIPTIGNNVSIGAGAVV